MEKARIGWRLGLIDLHSFNVAMLAKQGWRLIQTPDSLCARILKAKYFPNSNILEAKAKERCSYTWRSIILGAETWKHGIIWRVGNGQQINIWSDPWLPREITRRHITRKGRNLLTMVEELIDPTK
jgi:hypothetical protein